MNGVAKWGLQSDRTVNLHVFIPILDITLAVQMIQYVLREFRKFSYHC